jgi:hypothetical protein
LMIIGNQNACCGFLFSHRGSPENWSLNMARVAEGESVNEIHAVLAKLWFLRSISSSVGDYRPGRPTAKNLGRLPAPHYAISSPVEKLYYFFMPPGT